MGLVVKPYNRVQFFLFVCKSPRSGTTNLSATVVRLQKFVARGVHQHILACRVGMGGRGR